MAEGDGPVRTCIGCRARDARGALVRFVVAPVGDDGARRVVRDGSAKLPGRGAWLHDSEQCRDKAIRRRAFRRTLRIAGDVELHLPELGDAAGTDGDGHVTKPV